jgi:hypothetical protein
MTTPAIIVIAFNRPFALRRILDSISKSNYEDYKDIPLLISIDGGGNHYNDVVEIADNFNWLCGEKKVIKHSKNIGLRKHVISCGAFVEEYENIIILEEDCFVSRNFYDYAYRALNYYQTEDSIAGISLYSYNCFESAGMPFNPLNDGCDTYFVQVPSSLGQVWTKKQWDGFMKFYNLKPEIRSTDRLPEKVKTWPESSWKKYFYKYMVDNNLFFVYPQYSFSTNFGDVGTHFDLPTQLYQVPLENSLDRKAYVFASFLDSLNKYDAFFELQSESFIKLGVSIDKDTCIDMMGSKDLSLYNNQYCLSIKESNNTLKGFANSLNPMMLNILINIPGSFFNYAIKSDFDKLRVDKKYELINANQPLGFKAGNDFIVRTKYYKLGFYLLHPQKLIELLKRRLS